MSLVPVPADIATVTETNQGLEIEIPVKRNPVAVAFLCLWLCPWGLGEAAVIVKFLNHDVPEAEHLFLLIWLGGWTAGGVIAIYTLLWMVAGKQRIILGNLTLAVVRELFGYKRAKEYDLAYVSRLNASPQFGSTFETSSGMRFWGLGGGPIAFDYGSKTIRVGEPVDEAEARRLCEAMLRRMPSLGVRSTT